MEQHPIPQDVTGFQFRLIGNMTVKQFAYVAVGVVSAVILYYLPFSGFLGFLTKAFFIPFLGGSGFALAFLPIEGRPIDLMIGNFIRALFSPNQFVYHKEGRHLATALRVVKQQKKTQQIPIVNKEQQLQQLLQATHIQPHTKLDEKEQLFLNEIATTPLGTPTTVPAPIQPQGTLPESIQQPSSTQIPPQPATQPVAQTIQPPQQMVQQSQTPAPKQPVQPIQQPQIPSPQQQVPPPQKEPEPLAQPIEENIQPSLPQLSKQEKDIQLLQKQVELLQQKNQQLQEELIHIQAQPPTPQPATQPVAQTIQPPQQMVQQSQTPAPKQPVQPIIQYVRNIPKELLQQAGLTHLPDTPNVAIGIVKDARGNVLPNMLVEIKDVQGNPVRAFKTNPLGQFASATPLSPGVYTIELEDPKKQHTFDIIQFTANNQIMLPIEIISHDARESLRKELFT